MEYKRKDIKNYLIVYLILINIIFGSIFISRVNNRKQKEPIESQIETSKQNVELLENLINY